MIAFCNAVASAQLASSYPSSGGTYLFGREVLGPWWGFLAGWGFVVGKTASCAAMAMTFAAYALPGGGWGQRALAAGAVVAFTVLNLRGVTRTATAAKVLLAATLVVLLGFLALSAGGDAGPVAPLEPTGGSWGVLQAAGLLFFAFAGYARIATLAEEVRRPELLGRAILVALGAAVVVYTLVGLALVRVLGADLPDTATPIAAATAALGADWAEPLVRSAPPRPPSARCWRSSPASGVRRSRWRASATCPRPWRPWIRATRCRTGPRWSSASPWWRWCCSPTCAARSASRPSACSSTTPSPTCPPCGSRVSSVAGRARCRCSAWSAA